MDGERSRVDGDAALGHRADRGLPLAGLSRSSTGRRCSAVRRRSVRVSSSASSHPAQHELVDMDDSRHSPPRIIASALVKAGMCPR